ncbi:MAG: S8 family serine peptidase, partial [Tumebacillaceae bacterium]
MSDLQRFEWLRPGYHDWATERINGSHATVGVVDTGITIESHVSGRVTDVIRRGIGPGELRNSGHGLMVSSVIGGVCSHCGAGGFPLGQGIAPHASVLNQYNTSGTFHEMCSDTARTLGTNGRPGYVQNNSWSIERENPPRYGDFERQYDLAVRHASGDVTVPEPLIIVFGSGNSGSSGLRRPASAKNIITVGASWRLPDESGESVRMWEPSSIGDCPDGRIKPDLIAPTPIPTAFPAHIEKQDNKQIDAGHRWFGGTSAAAAVVSGGIALVVDGWSKWYNRRPAPSMVKAILINDAEDTGIGGPAPNP